MKKTMCVLAGLLVLGPVVVGGEVNEQLLASKLEQGLVQKRATATVEKIPAGVQTQYLVTAFMLTKTSKSVAGSYMDLIKECLNGLPTVETTETFAEDVLDMLGMLGQPKKKECDFSKIAPIVSGYYLGDSKETVSFKELVTRVLADNPGRPMGGAVRLVSIMDEKCK